MRRRWGISSQSNIVLTGSKSLHLLSKLRSTSIKASLGALFKAIRRNRENLATLWPYPFVIK